MGLFHFREDYANYGAYVYIHSFIYMCEIIKQLDKKCQALIYEQFVAEA